MTCYIYTDEWKTRGILTFEIAGDFENRKFFYYTKRAAISKLKAEIKEKYNGVKFEIIG